MGSTGSVGTQTLAIVKQCPHNFKVVGLAAHSRINILLDQIKEFRPQMVAIFDHTLIPQLEAGIDALNLVSPPAVYGGSSGVDFIASQGDVDLVVAAIVGLAGLRPTIAAINAGRDIVLANKEALVSAGPLVIRLVKEKRVKLLPADSEHSAIWQALQGVPRGGVKKLILTASGGAFRDLDRSQLANVRLEDALKHPQWSMGPKITIDCASLINKGLEVLEAHFLFGIPLERIEVVLHPQSIVHSLIETSDSSLLAQMGTPDMRLPLAFGMTWPSRLSVGIPSTDLTSLREPLEFKPVDHDKYPGLQLAYRSGLLGGLAPAVFNAANEAAVSLFREEKIKFVDIPVLIKAVLDRYENLMQETANEEKDAEVTLDGVLAVSAWAERAVREEFLASKKALASNLVRRGGARSGALRGDTNEK